MPLHPEPKASRSKATIAAVLAHSIVFSVPMLGLLAYLAGIEIRLLEIATLICLALTPRLPASTVVLALGLRRKGFTPDKMLPSCLLSGVALVISSAVFHLAFWPLVGEHYYDLPELAMILTVISAVLLPVVLLATFALHRTWIWFASQAKMPN
ncbi:hypothetical protein ACEWPL_014605 [Roseovarius sp. S1116L3]|uniref:hypothetical protein n=1 Tax=Roseovarius roseus TaxID=3342636 RepID=UPI0037261D7D